MRYLALAALLLAAPLSAQDSLIVVGTIPVPAPTVIVQGDSVFVDVEVRTDSLAAAIQGAQESLAAAIRGCDCAGPSGVDRGLQGAFLALGIWAVWEFRRWVSKESVPDITDVDVDVDVDGHHDHGHGRKHD